LRIKKIRSDNGTEFKNSQIEGFLEEEGIKHEFSSPYTPQQNGVVERKNRTEGLQGSYASAKQNFQPHKTKNYCGYRSWNYH
jgi:transposase InsO family protein